MTAAWPPARPIVLVGADGRVGALVRHRLLAADVPVRPVRRADDLASAVAGSSLLLNCASLTPRPRIELAELAVRAGVGLVDVGGLPAPRELVGTFGHARLPLVLGAGMIPGLAEMMPAWLTPAGASGTRIAGYVVTREPLTVGAAQELLDSGPRSRRWESGREVPAVPLWLAGIPGTPGPMLGLPDLSPALAAYAARTQPAELSWFHCHEPDSPVIAHEDGPRPTAQQLVSRVSAYLGGRESPQFVACQVSGRTSAGRFEIAGVLGGISTYVLTAGAACWFAERTLSQPSEWSGGWAGDAFGVEDLALVARRSGVPVAQRWSGSLSDWHEGTL
ncbi:hypothetical protein AB0H36_34005 [Kribbella sp. NPDC050820]|uniref:hypothetical protein n=1 Tax=Kribbella sp. NPDC050820 TaxID=3155408 RepID=UPI0033C113D2